MLLKTKFFLKGVKFSVEVFMILAVWAYYNQNERLKKELDEVKSKKSSYTSYYYKKHPKSGPVPKEKPKNPIGFTGGLYD